MYISNGLNCSTTFNRSKAVQHQVEMIAKECLINNYICSLLRLIISTDFTCLSTFLCLTECCFGVIENMKMVHSKNMSFSVHITVYWPSFFFCTCCSLLAIVFKCSNLSSRHVTIFQTANATHFPLSYLFMISPKAGRQLIIIVLEFMCIHMNIK